MDDLYTEESHIVDICDVDYKGRLKLSYLFNRFAFLATLDAQKCGMWETSMMNQYGWIVAKQTLILDQPIMLDDYIRIQTTIDKGTAVIFPRYYFVSIDGQVIGRCSSTWTLIDIQKRRITPPSRIGIKIPEANTHVQLPKPSNIQIPCAMHKYGERQVVYSDLDINQHMNNTRYIQWALDSIDYRIHEDAFIHKITIHYKKEIRPNTWVYLYVGHQDSTYYIEGKSKDNDVFFTIEIVFKLLEKSHHQ